MSELNNTCAVLSISMSRLLQAKGQIQELDYGHAGLTNQIYDPKSGLSPKLKVLLSINNMNS